MRSWRRPSGCSRGAGPGGRRGRGEAPAGPTLLDALLDFLPPAAISSDRGDETFDWLPQAARARLAGTGRCRDGRASARSVPTHGPVAPELSDRLPSYTWGPRPGSPSGRDHRLRPGRGDPRRYPRGGLDTLRRPPVASPTTSCPSSASSSSCAATAGAAVVAAHYVRPIARDVHGHVQRLGPAVLSTWDPARRLRALRLGGHPRARAARRPPGRRLRARGRPARDSSTPSPRPASPTSTLSGTALDGYRDARTPTHAERHLEAPHADPRAAPPPSPNCVPPAGGRAPSRRSCGRTCSPAWRPARRSFRRHRLRGDRRPGDRERHPGRPGHRVPGRARPGQDADGAAARRPARRVAAGRRRRRAQRRPVRARSAPAARAIVERDGDATAIDWLPRDRRYGEKLATPGHHDRRPDRRGRSDQGRRGPLPVRRADHPLRPDSAREPRHLRDQRAARPRRADPGRPAQHPRGARRPDPRLHRPPAAGPVRGRLAPTRRTTPAAAGSSPRSRTAWVADPDPLPAHARARDRHHAPGEAALPPTEGVAVGRRAAVHGGDRRRADAPRPPLARDQPALRRVRPGVAWPTTRSSRPPRSSEPSGSASRWPRRASPTWARSSPRRPARSSWRRSATRRPRSASSSGSSPRRCTRRSPAASMLEDLEPVVDAFEDGFTVETGERTPSREYVAGCARCPACATRSAGLGTFDVTDGAEDRRSSRRRWSSCSRVCTSPGGSTRSASPAGRSTTDDRRCPPTHPDPRRPRRADRPIRRIGERRGGRRPRPGAPRYSRWDGRSSVPDLDADEILDALSDDVMAEGDLTEALRRLMERGWRTATRPGRPARPAGPDGPAGAAPRGAARAIRARRRPGRHPAGARRDRRPGARGRRARLERSASRRGRRRRSLARRCSGTWPRKRLDSWTGCPHDIGERIRGLRDYDFLEPDARSGSTSWSSASAARCSTSSSAGMADAIRSMTPEDLAANREMVRDLNELIRGADRRRRTRTSASSWPSTAGSSRALRRFDDIIEQLAERMAAMQSLMRSMTPGAARRAGVDDGRAAARRPAARGPRRAGVEPGSAAARWARRAGAVQRRRAARRSKGRSPDRPAPGDGTPGGRAVATSSGPATSPRSTATRSATCSARARPRPRRPRRPGPAPRGGRLPDAGRRAPGADAARQRGSARRCSTTCSPGCSAMRSAGIASTGPAGRRARGDDRRTSSATPSTWTCAGR